MTKANWSSGPWRACKQGECQCGMIWSIPHDIAIVTALGKTEHVFRRGLPEGVVCLVHHETGDGPDMIYGIVDDETQKANARLIAAAPRLYEALEAAYTLMAKVEQSAVEHVMYDGRPVEQWERQARAALAAARGEE